MMNLGRSGLAFLSVCRPAFSFSSSSVLSKQSQSSRRGVLTAGIVIAAAARSSAYQTHNPRVISCEKQNPSGGSRLNMSSASSSSSMLDTGYLNAADAAALDAELMSTPGFSLEQLMELAGLSVAEAVYQVVSDTDDSKKQNILLICGPGNNGGDGLVAARHLIHFGYSCTVVYPKKSSKQHFINLIQQCEDVGVEILDEMPPMDELESFAAIVDSIFGFSFHGTPREPFATALKVMMDAQTRFKIPVISVDVPSGWNVDEGMWNERKYRMSNLFREKLKQFIIYSTFRFSPRRCIGDWICSRGPCQLDNSETFVQKLQGEAFRWRSLSSSQIGRKGKLFSLPNLGTQIFIDMPQPYCPSLTIILNV